jgi:hypothetical protein
MFSSNQVFMSSFRRICLVLLAAALANESAQAAIITTPGLTTVRVWEVTGGPSQYNFPSAGAAMTTQLGVGTLSAGTNDFSGLANENYDVFYSDANGAFNVNGNYVTVEAIYPNSNGGGGLNLAAVDLVIGSGTLRADVLSSWVGLGPNFVPGSVLNSVDADTPVPTTITTMGSTVVPPAAHLRVTVTWSKLGIPEPSSCMLAVCGLVGVIGTARRRFGV